MVEDDDWGQALRDWLAPFLARLGHKARRRMLPLYVCGLIGPGDRKSVQPMAARLAPGDYDQLHHFVAAGVWLDHFEGRSWSGLHRHALMTMIAFAFLQDRRLKEAGGGKKNRRPAASAELTGRPPGHRRHHASTTKPSMPTLQTMGTSAMASVNLPK